MSQDSTPRDIIDVLDGVLERLQDHPEASPYYRRFRGLRDRTVWTAPEDHHRYWVAGQAIIDEMVYAEGASIHWVDDVGQFWAGRQP